MRKNSTLLMLLLALGVFIALIAVAVIKNNAPSKYDEFAQCIDDAGGKMYGAYWCPHCQDQEEMFGSAFRHIDYVECSSQGSRTFDLCPDIQSTPTWEDADGTRTTGTQTLAQLSERYGCELPQ